MNKKPKDKKKGVKLDVEIGVDEDQLHKPQAKQSSGRGTGGGYYNRDRSQGDDSHTGGWRTNKAQGSYSNERRPMGNNDGRRTNTSAPFEDSTLSRDRFGSKRNEPIAVKQSFNSAQASSQTFSSRANSNNNPDRTSWGRGKLSSQSTSTSTSSSTGPSGSRFTSNKFGGGGFQNQSQSQAPQNLNSKFAKSSQDGFGSEFVASSFTDTLPSSPRLTFGKVGPEDLKKTGASFLTRNSNQANKNAKLETVNDEKEEKEFPSLEDSNKNDKNQTLPTTSSPPPQSSTLQSSKKAPSTQEQQKKQETKPTQQQQQQQPSGKTAKKGGDQQQQQQQNKPKDENEKIKNWQNIFNEFMNASSPNKKNVKASSSSSSSSSSKGGKKKKYK